MSIKHDHTLNPVTALASYRNPSTSGTLILAGEGCYMKVFDAKTSILSCQVRVFENQAIHGITVQQNESVKNDDDLEIAIWGASSLTVLTRNEFKKILDSSSTECSSSLEIFNASYSSGHASDWILDVIISQNGLCILVTAHNTVLRAKIEGGSLNLEALHSPSKSILYSAQLLCESENNILAAAGTVFGEIIVWRCSIDAVSSRSQILHTFTGHEGSIFGVSISPVVVGRDGKPTRLLASCSDDRTIRIWDLDLNGSAEPALGVIAGIETGFGGDEEQRETSSKCVAIVMGHASRIWSVQFLIKDFDITVLSFGEDATTHHWMLENSGYNSLAADVGTVPSLNIKAKLTKRDIFSFNSGKHIWSKAIRSLDDGRSVVATGGADGKISEYEIHAPDALRSRSWSFEDVLQGLPSNQSTGNQSATESILAGEANTVSESAPLLIRPQKIDHSGSQSSKTSIRAVKITKPTSKKPPKDAFNRYAFIAENQVLVTTTFGRVLLGEIAHDIKWKEIDMHGSTDLRSYSVIKGIPERGIAFLGSANGSIFSYRAGMFLEFGKIQGKVADMFAMYYAALVKVDLLATTLGSTVATLFKCSAQETSLSSLESVQALRLKLLDKFIVTSAGKIACHLVLGSRMGALAMYSPEKLDEPACTWFPATPGDAVTSISKLPESGNHLNPGYFVTTGRDGTYSIFSLADSISLVHQGTPSFGPMIEAAWFSGTDLFLYGFKSKNFIVWNETQQYEISSVECGGAHRSFSYSPVAGSGGAGYFIYTKASKLYLHSQSQPSHQIVKPGGHGREIKACAVSPDGLVATGAEDTAMRIWRYQAAESPVEKQFNCLAVVQKHTTGIQHLQWHGSSYLFSSGGNEEFFIWAVETVPGFGVGMVCEASCPDQSEESDLRIMTFEVSTLSVSENGSETLLISLAYSDSTIRCYTYSKERKFSLVATGQYTSCCLMQLRHLKIGQDVFFLTAGTDGHLAVWKTTLPTGQGIVSKLNKDDSYFNRSEESTDSAADHSTLGDPKRYFASQGDNEASKLTMLSNHRLHQSSIKSLDVATRDNQIIVGTGGDDNALGITIYKIDDLTRKPRSIMVRSAHAAAITGLSFVSKSSTESGGEMRIVTSSNDQRVKEWAFCESSDQMSDVVPIRKVGDVFTSIADVGDLAMLVDVLKGESREVLVVGNGMEVYKVSLETTRTSNSRRELTT